MTPFLQARPWLQLHQLGWGVSGVPAVQLLMAPLLMRLPRCVMINFGWDKKLSELLDQTYATVKLGNSYGIGQWRPFTIVLTGYENVAK